MIVGHESVLAQASQPVPVLLLVGPRGIGKRTVAQHLATRWNSIDTMFFQNLTSAQAADLIALTQFPPRSGQRTVIVRLNHVYPTVRQRLLTALEDSEGTRFILLDEQLPTAALMSRSLTMRMHPLTVPQVSTLLQRHGVGKKTAESMAALSDGSMVRARQSVSLLESKPVVLQAVQAIHDQDPVLLDRLSAQWTDEHTRMLRRWATEVVTREFVVYKQEDAMLPRPLAIKILTALASNVRPRLVVRSALMGLVVRA